jgi:hypothetical protein
MSCFHCHAFILKISTSRYDYTDSEIIDAIVNRKPIALKAIYYLIEKRLKQGLALPEHDELAATIGNHGGVREANRAQTQAHYTTTLVKANSGSMLMANNLNNTLLVGNGKSQRIVTAAQTLVKQHSQLLPKRSSAMLAVQTHTPTRSNSQRITATTASNSRLATAAAAAAVHAYQERVAFSTGGTSGPRARLMDKANKENNIYGEEDTVDEDEDEEDENDGGDDEDDRLKVDYIIEENCLEELSDSGSPVANAGSQLQVARSYDECMNTAAASKAAAAEVVVRLLIQPDSADTRVTAFRAR